MDHILQLGDARIDSAKLAELCRSYCVKELSIFGSVARGEMSPEMKRGLKPWIRPQVLKDAQVVYAA